MAKVGDIIGNYRLQEEIASGSFGGVYRGVHTILTTRIVAIKILHLHLQQQQESDTFFHEARLLEALEHPHILRIFDVGLHERMPYIVTAYASGGSLRQFLQRNGGKPLAPDKATSFLQQIAQALNYAHRQNVIHRDLKPENLLFDAQGNLLLADFGISSILGSRSFQQTSQSGTPAYMSPEQFKGEVSRESDQYALACIAYELLTGHRPFSAPDAISLGFKHLMEPPAPPRQLNRSLPEHINQAILRALSKERKHRFPDISAFIAALQTVPKTSQQWLTEGDTLWKLNRYEEALVAYEQAIRLDPNHAYAYHGKGNALWGLNRYEEALTAYEQTIRLNPNFAYAYDGKGNALDHLKRPEEALAAYEQAIRLDPNFANPYNGKGNILGDLKRNEEALTAYEQAIRLNPNFSIACNGKGIVLRNLRRYEEALTAYEQAIRLDPDYANAYVGKGMALENLRRNEEALAAYEQAIRLDPNSAYAYNGKGNALRGLKRYEEAEKAEQKARGLGYT